MPCWRGKTLLFLCDPQWFTKKLWKCFGVICEPVWNFFGTILGHSQTNLKFLWGNSQQIMNQSEISLRSFLVIHEPVWNFLWVIFGDSRTSLKFLWGSSQWFLVICEPVWNFLGQLSVISEPVRNFFGVILGDLPTTLKFLWGDSQWFPKKSELIQYSLFTVHF